MVDVVALIREAAAAALNAQVEVAQKAAKDLAPKDDLDLSESIKVTEATATSLVSQVYTNSVYALIQHENLSFRHDDGGPKYLERASLNEQPAIQAAGAKAAKDVLNG
jgi:hypothetical protein